MRSPLSVAATYPLVEAMAAILRRAGVEVTVRRPRGRDVGVACGQLRRRALSSDGSAEA